MAKSLAAVLIGVGLLIGCQQKSSMVSPLPPPNLDGPHLAAPRPTPQSPAVARAPKPATPAPEKPKPRMAGIPDSWIPTAPANGWKWIVIHHSATPAGSAAIFDREHRQKGWDELGYHFVIGNGTASGNGQVEVGSRWPKQKWGAHAKTPDNQFNDFGIGICLVGNFDIDRPTPQQLKSLAKLVAFLQMTYHIPVDHVIGHGQTKPTDCPGRNISVAEVRRMAGQILADAGIPEPQPMRTASSELLHPVAR